MSQRDDYLQAMGEIAVNFQTLESIIRRFACGLIAQDQKLGQIVTAGVPFSGLCKMLACLHRYRSSSDQRVDELCGLLKQAFELQDRRNRLVHSTWLTSDPDSRGAQHVARLKVEANVKRGLVVTFEGIEPTDLTNLAMALKEVAVKIQAVHSAAQDCDEAWAPAQTVG